MTDTSGLNAFDPHTQALLLRQVGRKHPTFQRWQPPATKPGPKKSAAVVSCADAVEELRRLRRRRLNKGERTALKKKFKVREGQLAHELMLRRAERNAAKLAALRVSLSTPQP